MSSIRKIAGAGVAALMVTLPLRAQTLTAYDVFTFQNFTHSNSEVNGRLAVGGNASLSSWAVGTSLGGFTDYSLVVGGNLTTYYGSVQNGRTAIGGTFNNTGTGFPNAYPPVVGGPVPIDFAAESARLTAISNSYAAMAPTGTTTMMYGSQLNFIGNSMLNIFTVNIADLQTATAAYKFITQPGATNVVNVVGQSASTALNNTGFLFRCVALQDNAGCVQGSNDGTPIDARKLLWNFNAQAVVNIGGSMAGSMLAPNATVTFGYGGVVGTVVAKSAAGNAEFYSNHDFDGFVPPPVTPTPEPATLGLLALGLAAIGAVSRRTKRDSN